MSTGIASANIETQAQDVAVLSSSALKSSHVSFLVSAFTFPQRIEIDKRFHQGAVHEVNFSRI